MPPLIKAIPASRVTAGAAAAPADELSLVQPTPPPAPPPPGTTLNPPSAPAISPASPELLATTEGFIKPPSFAGSAGLAAAPALTQPAQTAAPIAQPTTPQIQSSGSDFWDFGITQGFGPTTEPLDSAYGGYAHFNKGIDFATPLGTPVRSTIAGTVVSVGDAGDGWGTRVQIRDADGFTHNFGHLSGFNVRQGDTVQAGQTIGASGNSGASTGPHLSYDVWDTNGQYLDPSRFLPKKGDSIANPQAQAPQGTQLPQQPRTPKITIKGEPSQTRTAIIERFLNLTWSEGNRGGYVFTPEERAGLLKVYEDDLDAGASPGSAFQHFYNVLVETLTGNAKAVGPLARNVDLSNPLSLLQAAGGLQEMTGEALATIAEPATSQLPGPTADLANRFIELFPNFVGPAGGLSIAARAGLTASSTFGGALTEELGLGRTLGELAGPFVAPYLLSKARPGPRLGAAAEDGGLKPIDDMTLAEMFEEARQYGVEFPADARIGAARTELARLRMKAQPDLFGAPAAEPETRPDLELTPQEEVAKPLPGQRGLFGEMVDEGGNIAPIEGFDARPQMGSMRTDEEIFRGEEGIQGGMFGAESLSGGTRYQPGLGEVPLPESARPLTPEGEAVLRAADRGMGAPAFISQRMRQAAEENGIAVTPDMTPNDVIDALRAKAGRQPNPAAPAAENIMRDPGEVPLGIEGEGATPPPTQGQASPESPAPPAQGTEPVVLPSVSGIPTIRQTVKLSDIEYAPDTFQLRDVDPGKPYQEARVKEIVDTWDPSQFDPPRVVPHPTKPGKYIVTVGHHRTEAARRVLGNDAEVEVIIRQADVTDPKQQRIIQAEADVSNATQAPLNFRERIRTLQRQVEQTGNLEDAAGRIRGMTASQAEALLDAARLGDNAIDRVVAEKGLEPYITEIGRGMRVYGIDLGDANGLFQRIADAKKNARPTPAALRETIDKAGEALNQMRMMQNQGALFDAGQFEGMRAGLLGIIDANARIRTELASQRNSLVRKRNAVRDLTDELGVSGRERRTVERLLKLAEQEEARLNDLIRVNEEDFTRILRGEEPVGQTAKQAAEEAAAASDVPPAGGEPAPPDSGTTIPRPISNDPVDKLIAAVRSMAAARPDLLLARTQERVRRIARAAQQLERSENLSPSEAIRRARAQHRGQLADPSFILPATFTEADKDALRRTLIDEWVVLSEEERHYVGMTASEALEKIMNGESIPPSSAEALGQIFGPRLQDAIEELGDIMKVQRRVEDGLAARNGPDGAGPIEITLPDGTPITPDLLAEAMRNRMPGVDPNQLEIASERLIDTGKVRIDVGPDGKTYVGASREVDYDALESAAAREAEDEFWDDEMGLPPGTSAARRRNQKPSPVRTIPYQGVPEQRVPPTEPRFGGEDFDDINRPPRERPDGSLPGQRTFADVGGAGPGTGETIDIPPSRPTEGLTVNQTKILADASRAGLNDSQRQSILAAAEAGASDEQLQLLLDAHKAGPSQPFEVSIGGGEAELALQGQPTQRRMEAAPGPARFEIPPDRPLAGLSLDQVKVLAEAERRGLTQPQRQQLYDLGSGGASPEAMNLVMVGYAERNRLGGSNVVPGATAPDPGFLRGQPTTPRMQPGPATGEAIQIPPSRPTTDPNVLAQQQRIRAQGLADNWDLTRVPHEIWKDIANLASFPKAVKTFLDRSARLRQGGALIRHGKVVKDAWLQTEFIAEDAADALKWENRLHLKPGTIPTAENVMEAINRGKWAPLRRKAGLYIEEWGPNAKLEGRNENFMSNWSRKFPGMDMSERSFVVYLNKLRADVFDEIVEGWLRNGHEVTQKRAEDLAAYLNATTGRGNLGELEGVARLLSTLWFAPRNAVSRFQVLEMVFDPRTDNLVRKEMAKDLAVYIGGGITLLSLADLSGLAEVELDPRSSDFGKMKIGPTRLDFWGGYQQIARYGAMLSTGEAKASTGTIYDIDRLDVAARYLRNKLSPAGGFGINILKDEDFRGQDFELLSLDTARDLFAPLFLDDMYEAIKENGWKGVLYAPLNYYGVSVQSYTTPADERNKARDAESIRRFGVPYGELPDRFPSSGFTKQSEIDATDKVAEAIAVAKEASGTADRAAIDQMKADMAQREAAAIEEWRNGTSLKPLPEIWSDFAKERAGERRAIAALTEDNFKQDAFDKIIDGYFGQQVMVGGVIDWEQTILNQERYLARLPRNDRLRLEDFLGVLERRKTPEYQAYRKYLDHKEGLGYFAEGITNSERNALDRANPDVDVQTWLYFGGVRGDDSNDPILQSPEAVAQALAMNMPNRDVKYQGLSRPINQSPGATEAWNYAAKAIDFYYHDAVTQFGDQEAMRLYEKPYADLTEAQQATVTSNIRTEIRRQTPELDALLVWFGGYEVLQSQTAVEALKIISNRFGNEPPKEGFNLRLAEDAR